MPRKLQTLRERIDKIRKRYKYVNANRYFYNKKSDLRKSYNRIRCWFLIHDDERGYSVFDFEFRRKLTFKLEEWTRLFKHKVHNYEALETVLTQSVLPAINAKSGAEWTFVTLLGWTGIDDIQQGKDSTAHRKRNRSTKKRTANARGSNRRRQRN